MVYTLRFFSSKCSSFHNSNVFGSYIIHILYTGRAKIKKNNSGAKMLNNEIIKQVTSSWSVFIELASSCWPVRLRGTSRFALLGFAQLFYAGLYSETLSRNSKFH